MSERTEAEAARILAENRRREREIPAERYAADDPGHRFLVRGQIRALDAALARHRLLPLGPKRVLEVGCGRGDWLRRLLARGATAERLHGVDLDGDRLAVARERCPGADLRTADAAALPWGDGAFDLVLQSTVFSSILDPEVRRTVAAEMRRVTAPDGAVLWYDFFFDNPCNRQVRGIGRRELARLFPGWRRDLRRTTLAPPLARPLARRSPRLADLLESLRVLDTHYFGVLRPPGRGR